MFERFTDRARKVMALANQEAQRLNHEYIGTEHILLGLAIERSGIGAMVLKNLGADIRKLRVEVEKLVKSGPEMVTYGKLPQTPRAKRVIEFAIDEARSLNHRYVGTEHILLGLLRESEGIAAQVLINLGLQLEDVRQEVINLLGVGGRAASGRSTGLPSFTNDVKRVMALAHRAAGSHEYIETEHVLWALIKVGDEVAQEIFKRLNVDMETLRGRINGLPPRQRDGTSEGDLPQASHTRNALRYAIREAVALHRPYVGTEHLLLGLVSESDVRTGQILTDCGLTVDAVRQEAMTSPTEVSEAEADSLLRQSFYPDLLTDLGLPPYAAIREADELALQVYTATGAFPKVKARDIVSQMRRCALSVPPHLAEALRRADDVESRWFLSIAISALTELRYLLDFSLKQGYIEEQEHSALRALSGRVEKHLREFPRLVP
jgi:four helix bundle protein